MIELTLSDRQKQAKLIAAIQHAVSVLNWRHQDKNTESTERRLNNLILYLREILREYDADIGWNGD